MGCPKQNWKLWTTKNWKSLKDTTVIYSPIMRPHIPFQSFVCYFFLNKKCFGISILIQPSAIQPAQRCQLGDQGSCANQNWRQHKHPPPNTRELNDPLLVKLLQKRKHSSGLRLGVTKVRHSCSPGNPPLHFKLSYNRCQIRMPIKFSSPMRVKIMMMSWWDTTSSGMSETNKIRLFAVSFGYLIDVTHLPWCRFCDFPACSVRHFSDLKTLSNSASSVSPWMFIQVRWHKKVLSWMPSIRGIW